jgi:plastocyanin
VFRRALILAFALFATRASAADLTISVKTSRGEPVKNAVVMAYPAAGKGSPTPFDWPMRLSQKDLQFETFVLVVPVGGLVAFPNHDPVRHQVYSFSPAKAFELKLYGKDESRSVRFDKPGVVSVGCNIHDAMVAFIRVVDTPFAIKTGASGIVTLRGLPPGAATVRVWHPYLKAPGGEKAVTVTLPREGGISAAVVGDLRTPPMTSHNY